MLPLHHDFFYCFSYPAFCFLPAYMDRISINACPFPLLFPFLQAICHKTGQHCCRTDQHYHRTNRKFAISSLRMADGSGIIEFCFRCRMMMCGFHIDRLSFILQILMHGDFLTGFIKFFKYNGGMAFQIQGIEYKFHLLRTKSFLRLETCFGRYRFSILLNWFSSLFVHQGS